MKRFRILGILAILVIVGDFAISFTAGWQEERDSFLAGSKSRYLLLQLGAKSA